MTVRLQVPMGTIVQINTINGDGAMHDLVAADFNNAKSDQVTGKGASTVLAFCADKKGEFFYWCSVSGHRPAGMEGKIIVGEGAVNTGSEADDMTLSSMAVPEPIGDRGPETLEYTLETVAVEEFGATGELSFSVEKLLDEDFEYLVNHALSIAECGLAGFLTVEGEADSSIFDAHGKDTSGHCFT